MIADQPKNTLVRIDSVYAFVSVDPDDGYEGLVAYPYMNGAISVPLIAADPARLESIRPLAQQCADFFKIKIKLIKLTSREELEVLTPQET